MVWPLVPIGIGDDVDGHVDVERPRHLEVGQIAEREADGLGREAPKLTPVLVVAEDLQVEEADVVAGGAHRRGHPLGAERLELQADLGVHSGGSGGRAGPAWTACYIRYHGLP